MADPNIQNILTDPVMRQVPRPDLRVQYLLHAAHLETVGDADTSATFCASLRVRTMDSCQFGVIQPSTALQANIACLAPGTHRRCHLEAASGRADFPECVCGALNVSVSC